MKHQDAQNAPRLGLLTAGCRGMTALGVRPAGTEGAVLSGRSRWTAAAFYPVWNQCLATSGIGNGIPPARYRTSQHLVDVLRHGMHAR